MSIPPARRHLIGAALSLMLLGACDGIDTGVGADAPPTGFWQVSIELPGASVRTAIELSREGEHYTASLVNGQERIRIDEVSYVDRELTLFFPAFNNTIRARYSDGALQGELVLVKRYGATQTMPFLATIGDMPEPVAKGAGNYDMSGRWAVRFHETDGSDSFSVGEFAQRGSRLFGTFLNPNGDHRFLAGHIRGDRFHLSTFDGSHAFVFSGSINADGNIVNADFWSGTTWHQKWSAEPDDSAALPDGFSRTWLKPGYERFEFAFPNENGTTVSFDDDRFKDKVVLVTLAGTWCPNCNDEARFLAEFHKQYREQGLEVVMLLFEHMDDPALAAQQAERLRAKHGIEFDTLIAGVSIKEEAEKALPALDSVLAFPTTIFIDRDARVRQIYAGFSGPGTGDHYEQLKARFIEQVTTLLAEPPDLIESPSGDSAADTL